MTPNMINLLTEHCILAARKGFAWNPVYADIIKTSTGEKVGHIVSDGLTNTSWSFYPIEPKAGRLRYAKKREQAKSGKRYHRVVNRKDLEMVVPKWVGKFSIANIHDFDSKYD